MSGVLKRVAAVSLTAATLTGIVASFSSALALPFAPPPMALAATAGVQTVQYYRYGYPYRGYYRPFRRYPGYRGRAGVYGCGLYQLHTHLSRKACR